MRPFLRSFLAMCFAGSALLAVVACSSAPPVRFHTLMPPDVTPRAEATSLRPPMVVALEPIRLSAQVDQPQWLVRLPDDSMAVLEQERWASPLRDEFRQALLESLIVRYGIVDARGQAQGTGTPVRVAIDVRRFESVPGREARIEGSWTVLVAGVGALAMRCDWLIREAAMPGMPGLAAAHRRGVARLGDALGEALLSLRVGGVPSACPVLDKRS